MRIGIGIAGEVESEICGEGLGGMEIASCCVPEEPFSRMEGVRDIGCAMMSKLGRHQLRRCE